MREIKKLILLFLLIGLVTEAASQNIEKQANKRAKLATAFLASEMDLNKKESDFLYDVLYEKILFVKDQITNRNLSQDDKKEVYNKSTKDAKKKLSTNFSPEQIKQILKSLNNFNSSKKVSK